MPARSAPAACYLHIVGGSWQGHVEDSVDVELRLRLTHETVLVFTAVEVAQILAHYAGGARITSGLLTRVASSEHPRAALPSVASRGAIPRAVGVPLRPEQEARRAARARRRRPP